MKTQIGEMVPGGRLKDRILTDFDLAMLEGRVPLQRSGHRRSLTLTDDRIAMLEDRSIQMSIARTVNETTGIPSQSKRYES